MRARQVPVPALEAVVESVEVPVAALPVQTAVDRAVPAAVLALASVAARAAGQVPVLLQVEAPQQGPGVVRVLLVDREVFPVGRALAPAAGWVPVLLQVGVPQVDPVVDQALRVDREVRGPARAAAVIPLVAPVVLRAPPAGREVPPVVQVSALPAALRAVRPEARVARGAAVVLQRVQAVDRAMVEAGAAPVAGQEVVDRVADPAAGRVVVARGVAQPAAARGPVVMARVV